VIFEANCQQTQSIGQPLYRSLQKFRHIFTGLSCHTLVVLF